MEASKYMQLITIEGNIAVGKSTLIEKLRETFSNEDRVVFLPEPVGNWLSHGFLQGMYNGTISKSGFQHMVLASMTAALLDKSKQTRDCVIVQERSLECTYKVFSKANLEDIEHEVFTYSAKLIINSLSLPVTHVYLRLDHDNIMKRLSCRGRESECLISDEYIRRLNDLHDEWLLSEPSTNVIDAARSTESCAEDMIEIIRDSLEGS